MSDPQLRLEYQPDFGRHSIPPRDSSPNGRSLRGRSVRAGALLLGLVAAVILPFVLLVRLSVFAYAIWRVGNWMALVLGGLGVLSLLFAYVLALRLRFQRKLGVPKIARRALAVIVGSYLAYALIFLSGANAKTGEIRAAYSALNPILRVATGTVLLVDRNAVVTDVGRSAEEYIAWGLPVNEASLHFEQEDGFVHAVDLRTLDRPAWRSWSLQTYYRLMGFRTLRHVGTADHLHVSMPLTEISRR